MNQTTTAISQKESRTGGNDDKNQSSKAGCKNPLDKKDEAENAKRKPARISIGKYEATSVDMMEEEGNQLGSSLDFPDSDCNSFSKDVVHVRKKQKNDLKRLQEEGRAIENNQAENNDVTEGDENDDLVHGQEEATAVVVPMFVEDDDENPNEESFRKLKKWTNELLGIKKKLEGARLENAVLLNKLYTVGAKRDNYT